MKRRVGGLTLIELLAVVAVLGLLTVALARAYAAGVTMQSRMADARERTELHLRFEEELRRMIAGARLSRDIDETASFFIGGGAGLSFDPGTLTFTALITPSGAYINSDLTFEELNERFGPHAGIAEMSLSMTPVGAAGEQAGLFFRRQVPPDGDPTQGGLERVLHSGVERISFEFFDGLGWVDSWDTNAQAEPRLPAAVLVTYVLADSPDRERTIVVRLPMSDVTPDDPAGSSTEWSQ